MFMLNEKRMEGKENGLIKRRPKIFFSTSDEPYDHIIIE